MASVVNSSAGAKYPKSGQAGAFSGVRGDRRLLDGKNTAVTLVSLVKAAEAANLELTISAKPRPLNELRPLAERLAQARNPAEAARLKRQLIKGYYGSRVRRAAHA